MLVRGRNGCIVVRTRCLSSAGYMWHVACGLPQSPCCLMARPLLSATWSSHTHDISHISYRVYGLLCAIRRNIATIRWGETPLRVRQQFPAAPVPSHLSIPYIMCGLTPRLPRTAHAQTREEHEPLLRKIHNIGPRSVCVPGPLPPCHRSMKRPKKHVIP